MGGGVLRDLLLDRPPYSIQHWPNITVALIAVAIATPLAHVVLRMNTAILVLDAIGMGFFATSGAAIDGRRGRGDIRGDRLLRAAAG